jgi:hypothetical protein
MQAAPKQAARVDAWSPRGRSDAARRPPTSVRRASADRLRNIRYRWSSVVTQQGEGWLIPEAPDRGTQKCALLSSDGDVTPQPISQDDALDGPIQVGAMLEAVDVNGAVFARRIVDARLVDFATHSHVVFRRISGGRVRYDFAGHAGLLQPSPHSQSGPEEDIRWCPSLRRQSHHAGVDEHKRKSGTPWTIIGGPGEAPLRAQAVDVLRSVRGIRNVDALDVFLRAVNRATPTQRSSNVPGSSGQGAFPQFHLLAGNRLAG